MPKPKVCNHISCTRELHAQRYYFRTYVNRPEMMVTDYYIMLDSHLSGRLQAPIDAKHPVVINHILENGIETSRHWIMAFICGSRPFTVQDISGYDDVPYYSGADTSLD